MPITLDDKQATLLGFTNAGWEDYGIKLQAEGVTVYTTTTTILERKESIYWASHGTDELRKKSQQKKKDPKSVSSALTKALSIMHSLEEPDTRKNIVEHVIRTIGITHEDEIPSIIDNIEKDDNRTRTAAMLEFLISEIEKYYAEKVFDDEKKEVNLRGYAFIQAFSDEEILKDCLKGKDAEKFKPLKEWISYVDLTTKSEDLQISLALSKSMLTDTLQRNLILLKEDKPLVPIHFVVSSEEPTTPFAPDWKKVTEKQGFVLTNAEIRMAYKLMRETDDPLIREVMEKTVFFHKKTADGFQQIQPPWLENDWTKRTRSKNKPEYKLREESEVPQWIKQIRALSRETALAIEKTSSPKKGAHIDGFFSSQPLEKPKPKQKRRLHDNPKFKPS